MPDYSKSKVYMIASPNTTLIYVGSTIQTLSKRMCSHTKGNKTTSKIIIDYGDAYIELIEEYPCENKEQLKKREGEIIKSCDCVNKAIAGRSKKEWYLDNREKIIDKSKKWNEENKEDRQKYLKQYYSDNKDKLAQYSKENQEKKNAKQRERRNRNKQIIFDI